MFSLLGGIVAAAATTALGAFTEGVVVSIIAYGMMSNSNTSKASISLKK